MLQVFIKFVVLRIKRNTFRRILRTIGLFWTSDKFPALTDFFNFFIRVAYIVTKFYIIYFAIVTAVHALIPCFHKMQIVKVWLPFDRNIVEGNWFYMILNNIVQIQTIVFPGFFIVISCETLFGFMLILAILQFRMLQFGLQNLTSDETSNCNKMIRLNSCIEYHKILLE